MAIFRKTPARAAALKRAQAISARKRKVKGKAAPKRSLHGKPDYSSMKNKAKIKYEGVTERSAARKYFRKQKKTARKAKKKGY